MPNLNGTGPEGNGPLTGRKRGRCSNSKKSNVPLVDKNTEVVDEIIYGRGRGGRPYGEGRGEGLGRRRRRFGNK